MRNAVESAKLEMELKVILPEINDMLIRIEAYATCVAIICDTKVTDEEFVAEMQMKQSDLLRLVNKLNDIAMRAMAINDRNIVFTCETEKAKVVNVMETVRNLYM